MVAIAARARTAFAIAAAGSAIAAGLLLKPGTSCELVTESSTILRAKLQSSKVMVGDNKIAVMIAMPSVDEMARPPLSLVVVLDRSGSMHGEPLENAKRAATTLIDKLGPNDAFALVTYSDTDQLVLQMDRADAAHKADARTAIDRIYDDGGTCTSCGITRGAAEMARTPIAGGVHRMVLISDGQANEGIWDRDELFALAQDTAAHGLSISTVGVGLDFDEQTMIRLGEVGRGHYYFVEDTANLDQMFSTELASLGNTVATDLHLIIEPHGSTIEGAYGYPVTQVDGHYEIPIADMTAGETRKVVLYGSVTSEDVARFELRWRRTADSAPMRTATTLATVITTRPSDVSSTRDVEVENALSEAAMASTLEEATKAYEQGGAEPAKRLVRRQLEQAHGQGVRSEKLERAANDAINSFEVAPADQAKKANRTRAYELAR